MIGFELVKAYAFSAPIVCALVCMGMMMMDAVRYRRNTQEKRLRLFLALTYIVTSLGWLGLVLYAVDPWAYVCYHPVFLLTLMLDQVMFYRFVSVITNTESSSGFNKLHWVVPLFITASFTLSDMEVPVERQLSVIYGDAMWTHVTWFNVAYTTTTIIFIVYNTLYPLLNLLNIRRYRRFIVNYSSDAQRTSLGWLAVMQALILVSVPIPLAGLLLNIQVFSTFGFIWFGALPTFVFYLVLCYNMLDDNYLIIQPETPEEEISTSKATLIDRKHFVRYLREKKPYLDPKLRITDLAVGLHTNRSYLSAFINREYGMNFSRLINRCRLIALDRLRLAPENAGKSNIDLVLMAGFSGYRNYLRVKTEEDKLTLLKFGQ